MPRHLLKCTVSLFSLSVVVTARLTGLFFLALFLTYGYLAQDIQLDFWASAELFDARTFPSIIAVAGTIASLLLILFPTHAPMPALKGKLLRPALLIGLMLLYSIALEPLGFIVSTLAFLLCGFALLSASEVSLSLGQNNAPDEEKTNALRVLRHRLIVGPLVAIGVSVFFYLLMTWLGIHLEPGILGFLHD